MSGAMDPLHLLPCWIAEPWHDAEDADEPVAKSKKWLEVAEALLERLAIGVVAQGLDQADRLDESTRRRLVRALWTLKDRRASFGDWVGLVALGAKGPVELKRAVFGVERVEPFAALSACAQVVDLALRRPPNSTTLLEFFNHLAQFRNEFVHGHAAREHNERLARFLGGALPEVLIAVPALTRQVVYLPERAVIEGDGVVVTLRAKCGTGRTRRTLWQTRADDIDISEVTSAALLWDGQSPPVRVPAWMLFRSPQNRVLPWQGGTRDDGAFLYVDRAEIAGAESQFKMEGDSLRANFSADLIRLGYDPNAPPTPLPEATGANGVYRTAASIAFAKDGVIDPDERAHLDALAATLSLSGSEVGRLEEEAYQSSAPRPIDPPRLESVVLPARGESSPATVGGPKALDMEARRVYRRQLFARLAVVAVLALFVVLVGAGDRGWTAGSLVGQATKPVMDRTPPKLDWVDVPASDSVAAFQIMRTEVTVRQYLACVAAEECAAPHWDDKLCVMQRGQSTREKVVIPDSLRELDRPVTCVDYENVQRFARWMGARLPTADEWTLAARDSQVQDEQGRDKAETCETSVIRSEVGSGCGKERPSDVCSRPQRGRLKLCDMAGNVFEWVESGPYLAQGAGEIRGGSWTYTADWAAVDKAGKGKFDEPGAGLGFRLAQ